MATDSQVLQCNASNVHGYIFTNVYLNVLGMLNDKGFNNNKKNNNLANNSNMASDSLAVAKPIKSQLRSTTDVEPTHKSAGLDESNDIYVAIIIIYSSTRIKYSVLFTYSHTLTTSASEL